MKPGRVVIAGWLVAISVEGACAQSAGRPAVKAASSLRVLPAIPETAALGSHDAVLREIEDPFTGDRWLLLRDANRPAAPGRLVLAGQQAGTTRPANHGPAQPKPAGERPMIRAGDPLIVEEHSAAVDARLEAIALGSAAKGAHLKARLQIGGKVVRVVAVSHGRAVFAPESEEQP